MMFWLITPAFVLLILLLTRFPYEWAFECLSWINVWIISRFVLLNEWKISKALPAGFRFVHTVLYRADSRLPSLPTTCTFGLFHITRWGACEVALWWHCLPAKRTVSAGLSSLFVQQCLCNEYFITSCPLWKMTWKWTIKCFYINDKSSSRTKQNWDEKRNNLVKSADV